MSKPTDCFVCGRQSLTRNEIGLNQKLINRNIKKFHCIDCLAEYLEVDTEFLLDKVKEFQEQGCDLF